MRYLPFLSGIYSTAPGLMPVNKASELEDTFIFQIDDSYDHYLQNKLVCRNENLQKYYCECNPDTATVRQVNEYIASQLVKEYPALFEWQTTNDHYSLLNKKTGEKLQWGQDWQLIQSGKYVSLFDALCCQVQEDIAVCQVQGEKDFLSAIHLCSPNHWAPADKVGQPFNKVHEPVPGMEKMMQHYPKMLASIIEKGPFTRFAWGIATDTRLNHHPQAPIDTDAATWHGRTINAHDVSYYIRTERQNLVGFPAVNAFMFTIRTYFYDVATLQPKEKKALLLALHSMSAATRRYKGLEDLSLLIEKLSAE